MDTMDKQDGSGQPPKPVWQRLGWFVLLWAVGAGVLWIISLLIRWAVVPS